MSNQPLPNRYNRFWRLLRHPEGSDFAAALSFEKGPITQPAEGEVLIANELISLDAGTRMWMSPRTDGYQPPLPLGSPMRGLVVGRIIDSRNGAYRVGTLVRAFGTWSDYSCVDPTTSGLFVVDESVSDKREHLGALGMNAWPAFVGITDVAKTRPGETVLVSAAAGATGMLAAQIAKIMGCRVIGIAGGPAKCAFLQTELGLDGAIDYKAPGLETALDAISDTVDVYFDNVGGSLLDAVLPRMAHYGRVIICGLMAGYSADEPMALQRFDQVLMRRLTISGVFAPDFGSQGGQITRLMKRWLDEGRIKMRFDVTHGLEHILCAYGKLFSGGNIGKVLLSLER
jgi:NADPH-dependent curcumin reductase CurA